MNIEAHTSALSVAIDAAVRAIPAKANLPILTHVLMQADESAVKFTCSDGALTITATCDAMVHDAGALCLPGKLFNDFVRKLPSEPMRLKTKGLSAEIKCAGCVTKMAGLEPGLYPGQGIEVANAATVTIKQAALKRMVSKVKYTINPMDARTAITGAYLEIDQHGAAKMTATNGFGLCQVRDEAQNTVATSLTAIIPHRAVTELAKQLRDEGDVVIYHAGNRMRFAMGDVVIDTVLVSGEYVNYGAFLKTGSTTEIIVNRRPLLDTLSRAALLQESGVAITLSIVNHQLTVGARSKQGELTEQIDVDQYGEDLDIAFNHISISDTLNALDGDAVRIKFNGPVGICTVESKTFDGQICIMLPVRRGG